MTNYYETLLKRRKIFRLLLLTGVVGTLLLFVCAVLRILPKDMAIVLPVGALIGLVLVVGGVGFMFTDLQIGDDDDDQE